MLHQPNLFAQWGVSLFRILWIGLFGCLLVRTGNLRITHPLAAAPAGTFQLVDNFDTLALGALHGQNGWQATTGINVIGDPSNAPNQVAEITASGAQAYKALPTAISNVNTGTLHFRLRRYGHIDGFTGLSDLAAPNDWVSYETQFGAQSAHAADEFVVRDSGQFDVLGNYFADQTWYCLWLVANNPNDSYQVYAQGGAFATPTPLDAAGQTTFGFRNGGGDALLTFLARMDTSKSQGSFYLDDIYVDPTGQNLASPGNNCNPVAATVGWQQTALTLQPGDQFTIVYTGGTWTVDTRSLPYAGPNGYSLAVDSGIHAGCKVNTDAPYAMLLGQVGGGAIFSVGLGGTFASDASGTLALRINDRDECLGDNDGSIGVVVAKAQTPAPSANFDAWPQNGLAPLTSAMHIVSLDNITSCAWDYGDGITGTACSAYHDHIYTTAGTYTVRLTVSGPGGADTQIRNNYITVNQPANQPPLVSISSPAPGATFLAGNPVTIGATASDADGAVTQVAFFVNSTPLANCVDPSAPYVCTWTPTTPGAYSLTAQATDNQAATMLATAVTVTILQPSTAAFSANPTTGNKPLTVNFIDQSTGGITSWVWSFGDGGTSTQQNPAHTYTTVGDFTVMLIVSGPGGSHTATQNNYIHVTEQLPTPPALPVLGDIANQDGDGAYTVSWSSSAGAVTYELQEQFSGGSWATVYTGSATSFNLTGKTRGEWCYQVRATNGGGSSDWSTLRCVSIPAGTAQPSLTLPKQASAAPGSVVTLQLTYEANANNIASLLFSVDYDQSKLTADSNGDGAPDAILFRSDLPASTIKAVAFDATDTDGELDFTIADFAADPQLLPSGVIATITLQVLPAAIPSTEAPVQFAIASFGGSTGDIAGVTQPGSVLIAARSPGIFLPVIRR